MHERFALGYTPYGPDGRPGHADTRGRANHCPTGSVGRNPAPKYARQGMDVGQAEPARYLEVAEESARIAGIVALGGFKGALDIRSKGGKDIVTQFDTAAEEAAIGVINKAFPTHAILGEESGASGWETQGDSNLRWAIDPIDGTHNYAMQLPFWCSSVALTDAATGKVLVGAVYDPVHEELFTATLGQGAYLNGERIQVSDTADPGE